MSDVRTMTIPDTFDTNSGKVNCVVKTEYQFQVKFQHPEIRENFDGVYAVRMQLRK